MSFDKETLFRLLPVLYQGRDLEIAKRFLDSFDAKSDADPEIDGPLKALLGVIAGQVAALEENLAQLYDDLFIETCAEWVVPYIGDLVGTRSLVEIANLKKLSARAQVANTLAYRRRKGTAAVLEQLAHDVTGWNSNVVEYFQLLATTQYMNHIRPKNLSMTSVKNSKLLEYSATPFDNLAHTVDVRNIERRKGKYNIPSIGIFLWRIFNFSSTQSPAFKVDDLHYRFDPLGKDVQLFTKAEPEEEITHLATPMNVPAPIRRRIMHRHLVEYYGRAKSVLLFVDGEMLLPEVSVPFLSSPPGQSLSDILCICDLSDWNNAPPGKTAIDPELGRIAFPSKPQSVSVSYQYGFSAEMGGGEYSRQNTFQSDLSPVVKINPGTNVIQPALDGLEDGGALECGDTSYYFDAPSIWISSRKKIEVRSEDQRRAMILLNGGEMTIFGEESAEVTINGLLIAGGIIRVPSMTKKGAPNKLKSIRFIHCTLAPGLSPLFNSVWSPPSIPEFAKTPLVVEAPDVVVEMDRCIVGQIRSVDTAQFLVTDSIIDAISEQKFAYTGLSESEAGAPLRIENTTVIGKLYAQRILLASNTIFLGRARAERLQEGCVRFSYVPPGSHVPRKYKCQPSYPEDANRVRPIFTSLSYGDAGYCQLSNCCAIEIREGADDQSEMGAFHDLYQPQRVDNLRTRLSEYLRFGLEAGIFFAS